MYGSGENPVDAEAGIVRTARRQSSVISYQGDRIPIHGGYVTFAGPGKAVLQTEDGETIGLELPSASSSLVRIGFDLFAEIELLLGRGQPAQHARIPALDLHISLLRDLIVGHSIPLCEIPPVPAGYNFIVCLTHDVDHCKIRNHRWDHTMFGFLYRATFGSLFGLCTGRKSVRQLASRTGERRFLCRLSIWEWQRTSGRHSAVTASWRMGLPRPFLLFPEETIPGLNATGLAPSRRAAHYDLAEIADELQDAPIPGLRSWSSWHRCLV